MAIDHEDYDILYRSMRECCLPAEMWMDTVSRFESCPTFTYKFTDEARETYKGRYVLPYPFKEPIWVAYARKLLNDQKRRLDSFNGEDAAYCIKEINDRAATFLVNAPHEDIVSLIDSNYDYGVVLHSMTGAYLPFQYSETVGFNFMLASPTGILDEVSTAMKGSYNLSMIKRAADIRGQIPTYHKKFFFNYTFEYRSPEGDDFCTPGSYGELTAKCMLTADQVKGSREYMEAMYQNHAKVMIVT